MTTIDKDQIKEAVAQRYGARAKEQLREMKMVIPLTVVGGSEAEACCAPSAGSVEEAKAKAVAKGYSADELAAMPESVTEISLGCGNPIALAEIREGDTVLDLGSGGGLDCFLAAQRVGPGGRVVGLDMTPNMLELARENARKMGLANVEFRQGEMEAMPVEPESVDLIISNCVINLSPDKDAVFREAYRVLRPGGRFCVSDIVAEGEIPEELRADLEEWASCAAGALRKEEFIGKLAAVGFTTVEALSEQETRRGAELCSSGWDRGTLVSAVIRAVKPL